MPAIDPRATSPLDERLPARATPARATPVPPAPSPGRTALLILGLVVAAFASSLRAPFVFDDGFIVEHQSVVAGRLPLGAAFTTAYWHGLGPVPGPEYRPLPITTLALERRLFGLERPWAFRLVNLAWHAGAALAVAALLARLGFTGLAPAVGGAVFAVHPLHVEAVVGIVGLLEPEQTAFTLATVLAFVARRRAWRATWPLWAFAALLSKEAGAVAPVLALATGWWLSLARGERVGSPGERALEGLVLVALWGLYVGLRSAALGTFFGDSALEFEQNPLVAATTATRVSAGCYLLWRYVLLIAWPIRLSADYSHRSLPLPEQPEGLWPVLWLLVGVAALAAVAMRRRHAGALAWTYVVGWFLTAMAVASNIPFPIGTVFGERLAYLASVAGAVALAVVVGRAAVARPAAARALVLATVGMLMVRTAWRGLDFQSEERLYRQVIAVYPDNVKIRFNLAALLAGRAERSAPVLRRALRDEALAHLDAALAERPGYVWALDGRGQIHLAEGRLEAAEADFRHILDGDADDPRGQVGVARVAVARGRCDDARTWFERVFGGRWGTAERRAWARKLLTRCGLADDALPFGGPEGPARDRPPPDGAAPDGPAPGRPAPDGPAPGRPAPDGPTAGTAVDGPARDRPALDRPPRDAPEAG